MGAGSLLSSRPDIYAGVAELARAFRERRASPIEALAACLQRIESLSRDLNAFITLDSAGAKQAAERAAREMERGEHRGLLHEIPVAVKDFFDTAGIRTTAASERFRNSDSGRRRVGGRAPESGGPSDRREDEHGRPRHGRIRARERIRPGAKPVECGIYRRRFVKRLRRRGRERDVLRDA